MSCCSGPGICGTWTFSTCDVGAQQAYVLNLGILVGVALGNKTQNIPFVFNGVKRTGVVVLASIVVVSVVVNRRMKHEEELKLLHLQNLDREERETAVQDNLPAD
jgi:hypothetical protein